MKKDDIPTSVLLPLAMAAGLGALEYRLWSLPRSCEPLVLRSALRPAGTLQYRVGNPS